MRLRGGRTTYGEVVGVLMLDTRFPRPPGDVGHAATFDFPVRYRTVVGATTDRVMGRVLDPTLLEPFLDAARELEDAGVAAITTSCGFLAPFQRELSAAVSVPVLTSALMQVPWVRTTLAPVRSIAVLTERADQLTEEHFLGVGWASGPMGVHVHGLSADAVFPTVFIDGCDELDTEVLRGEMRALAAAAVAERPETGAVVLECTNMSPFAPDVAEVTGLPVFDLTSLVAWVHRALRPTRHLPG